MNQNNAVYRPKKLDLSFFKGNDCIGTDVAID